MPLVTDYKAVKDIYAEVAHRGIGLPVFCAEDRETLEAILAAGLKISKEIGVEDLPVVPAWTCRYPARGQMALLTACGNPILGTRMMFSDLQLLASEDSPYRKLCIMPHLDHAFPWLDGDVLHDFADMFASVMCDASEKPFEENIRLTAEYVESMRGKVVVEGAVDEIYEAGGGEQKNALTTTEQAKEFLSKTGVDIIVPNVGTEHRSTASMAKYHSDAAKVISAAVGKIMCLHGTSSIDQKELSKLPEDGFIKINIYTSLAVNGGQALAGTVLDNLGNIFTEQQLHSYVSEGILGAKVLRTDYRNTQEFVKPKLKYVTNPLRRDCWFNVVRDCCVNYMKLLNYERFAS